MEAFEHTLPEVLVLLPMVAVVQLRKEVFVRPLKVDLVQPLMEAFVQPPTVNLARKQMEAFEKTPMEALVLSPWSTEVLQQLRPQLKQNYI